MPPTWTSKMSAMFMSLSFSKSKLIGGGHGAVKVMLNSELLFMAYLGKIMVTAYVCALI